MTGVNDRVPCAMCDGVSLNDVGGSGRPIMKFERHKSSETEPSISEAKKVLKHHAVTLDNRNNQNETWRT
jgi:hypothetical protein